MSFILTVKGEPLAIVCESKSKARELRKFLREAGYAKSDITIGARNDEGEGDKTKSRTEILVSQAQGEKPNQFS